MFNHLRKKIVSLMLLVLLATQSASAIEAHSPNRDNNLTDIQLHAVMGIITNFILSSDSTIKLESTPTLEIGSDSVTIKFIANQNAQGQIEYGTSTDYGYTTTKEFSFNYSSHTQTLTNLEAGTTYHYRVHFWNEDGVETISDDYTFSTLGVRSWRTGYYYPNRSQLFSIEEIPWNMYTHMIAMALRPTYNNETPGIDPNAYGLDGDNEGKIADFVNNAHQHNVKALFSLIHGENERVLKELKELKNCTSEANIDAFVALLKQFIIDNNYDGIDIDWEVGFDEDGFSRLINKLRESLGTEKLITVAGQVSKRNIYINVIDKIDQINMMFYDMDMNGYWGDKSKTWFNTSVRKRTQDTFGQNNYGTQEESLWYMLVMADLPPKKLAIGLPFYGRIKQGKEAGGINGITEPRQEYAEGDSISNLRGYISYSDLINSNYWTTGVHHWDDEVKAPYISYDVDGWENDAFITYTDPQQIQESVKLMKELNLGGMMTFLNRYEFIETETGDARYPLSKALKDAMEEGE